MSINLIPKECPRCNAPIEFSPYDSEVTCSRCHVSFEIERTQNGINLNLKARCPLGNGHDQIFKLTGIKRNKTLIDTYGNKIEPLIVSQIKAPETPMLHDVKGINFAPYKLEITKNFLIAILFVAGGLYSIIFTEINWLWIPLFLACIGLFYLSYQEYQTYEMKNERRLNWIISENQRLEDEYAFAKKCYENLFYCETHDEIFDMQTKAHFKVNRLFDYLYPNQDSSLDKAPPSS